jgi:hypothetical protein
MEHLLILVLLVWLIWRTRSPKARWYGWVGLIQQMNEIEALLKNVPISQIAEERKRAEERFILGYKEASWLHRLRRPKM